MSLVSMKTDVINKRGDQINDIPDGEEVADGGSGRLFWRMSLIKADWSEAYAHARFSPTYSLGTP